MSSSIGRGDPEYEKAMREAKELFDAAMAKASTKGRVGRPRTNPPPAGAVPPAPAGDVENGAEIADVAEIADLEDIADIEEIAALPGMALEVGAAEDTADATDLAEGPDDASPVGGVGRKRAGRAAGKANGTHPLRRRAEDA